MTADHAARAVVRAGLRQCRMALEVACVRVHAGLIGVVVVDRGVSRR